jgi:hypothetical protein
VRGNNERIGGHYIEDIKGQGAMIDEALDTTTHDMTYDGVNQSVVSDRDQVKQNIKIRLLLIQGEWFLNSQIGLPLFSKILVKNPDFSAIDVMIKATIVDTPEVTGLIAYSSMFNKTARRLSVSFQASTIYGNVTINNLEL